MMFKVLNLVSIITCHTNLVFRVSLFAGKKQNKTGKSESSGDVTCLKFESRTQSRDRNSCSNLKGDLHCTTYDRPTTRIVSCKSNVQLAYDCRVKHVLKSTTIVGIGNVE